MRNIFNTLLKVIGLWQVMMMFYNLMIALVNTTNTGIAIHSPDPRPWLGGLSLATVSFFFAWLFIFKTDWIADKVNIPKNEPPQQPLEKSTLLLTGTYLIGLYFLLSAIPRLSATITRIVPLWGEGISHFWIPSVMYEGIPSLVQIILSIICIRKADVIVKMMTEKPKEATT